MKKIIAKIVFLLLITIETVLTYGIFFEKVNPIVWLVASMFLIMEAVDVYEIIEK